MSSQKAVSFFKNLDYIRYIFFNLHIPQPKSCFNMEQIGPKSPIKVLASKNFFHFRITMAKIQKNIFIRIQP
ncbi:hypothetical protein COT99_04045 [Candidatus Falkowbacteria bacterium CG10_big_fil_rev_8_21_14_0_10_43_10]|uniref:Uncharacterized protein n=1 Tax=Candidatus Falkowbacteria bacterium CG10_big_fil_rev_8_21_14_0_10_43_10 TaxID=1974567 RepID=A0A2H0V164_9BACT|nr:MAG: hypothetical protein COT99_04045 [Candidatus Falkowbacteria bacterium CG10_big_fil_rev_8_21_14_0_10_43_10]